MKQELTDSQKLDVINERVKRMEIIHAVHTVVVVLAFIGILHIGDIVKKLKK